MKSTSTLLTGERVHVTVPDARALPEPVRSAVIVDGGRELELNAGGPAALDFYLRSTGSRLSATIDLRTATLRHGALGGRATQGRVFALTVGQDRVFGTSGPRVDLADLAAVLARVRLTPGSTGPSATLGRGLTWSARRAPGVAQVVDLAPGTGFLLDVRRAQGSERAGGPGIPVEGGTLSRSGSQEREPYLVLDAAQVVAYAIARPGTDLAVVARAMARVRVTLG